MNNYFLKWPLLFQSVFKLSLSLSLFFYVVLGIAQTTNQPHPIPSITSTHLSDMLAQKELLLIDVRTPAEFEQGHLEGALLIEYQKIAQEIEQYTADKDMPIALYCRSGQRSEIAAIVLTAQGYKNVVNLGGYEILKQMGYPAKNP